MLMETDPAWWETPDVLSSKHCIIGDENSAPRLAELTFHPADETDASYLTADFFDAPDRQASTKDNESTPKEQQFLLRFVEGKQPEILPIGASQPPSAGRRRRRNTLESNEVSVDDVIAVCVLMVRR